MSAASEWAELAARKPPEFLRVYGAATFVAKVTLSGHLTINTVDLRAEDALPFADWLRATFGDAS